MAKAQKFGTFGGVFVPSVLTILGVIMYLRLGWVVGNSGLLGAIIIILIAHVISVTTGLSVSSIATDKKVKAGGIYYMLSRSLGLPIGGSIGIALFVATALSIAMYIVGFAESFNSVIGLNTLDMEAVDRVNNLRITGTITLIVVCTIALVSTSLAIKTQYYILGAIALSLISIFAGGLFIGHDFVPSSRPMFSVPGSASMETVFAIFFPAVTGFTAGVALSGDLKDPKKSIPVGTMAAIGVGLVVYISLAIFLSATVDSTALMEDTNILSKIALFGAYGAPLLMAGIWGATLSSALGGILGGPRILQAMSLDKVTPNIFAKGVGKSNEPRNALIFAFFIAEAGILIGELDLIAPIVSMFYLTAYGFINLTCALESWSGSDFRPSFNIPRSISWLGAIATFTVMFKLDMLAMFAAFIVIGLIFLYLTRKQISMGFSDVWQGVWSEVVRLALSRIRQSETDTRSWRPNIILFSGSTDRRPHLLEYGTSLVGRVGLMSNFDLVEDNHTGAGFAKRDQAIEGENQNRGVFTRKYSCSDIYSGIERIAETYGFSGLDPNTILIGWARYTKDPLKFSQLINKFQLLDYSMLIMDYDQRVGFGKKKRIDIWSRSGGRHLTFALTISRFLNTSEDWQEAQIRLNILADTSRVDDMIIHQKLDHIQEELRVNFETRLLNTALVQGSYYEIVRYESADADMVYLELPDLRIGAEEEFFQQTDELCKEIGTVILYKGSSEFEEIDLSINEENLEVTAEQYAADLNYAALPSSPIPVLQLPSEPAMAQSLETIEDVSKSLIQNYVQEFLIPFAKKQVHFLVGIKEVTRQFYSSINGVQTDQKAISKAINKKEKELLQSALQQVYDFGEKDLEVQAQTLKASIEYLNHSIDGIIAKSTPFLNVDYDKNELSTDQLRSFNWIQRIQSYFGKTTLNYQLEYQKLVSVQFGLHLKQSLLAVHQQINQNAVQFGSEFRKSLRRMTAGIQNLKSGSDPNKLAERVQHESQQIHGRFNDLESKAGTQINAYRDFLMNDSISRFQKVSGEMDSLQVNTETISWFKTRKKWHQVDAQMEELVSTWGYNQPLELNVSELEIQLLLLQIELEDALNELVQQVRALPQRKVIQRSEKLVDTLERLIQQITLGKHLPSIGTHDPAELSELTDTIRNFIATSREIIAILPEKSMVPNLEGMSVDSYEEFESMEISPRDVVGHLIQTNLITQLESFSGQLQSLLSKADHTITDVQQVVKLALQDSDMQEDENSSNRLVATVHGEITRLQDSILSIEQLLDNQIGQLQESYSSVSQNLNARSIIKSALDFDYYLMSEKQTQVINKFTSISQNVKNYIQAGLTKLYYRRSEGVIAAKRFRVQKDYAVNWATATSKMIGEVSPDNQVIQELPFYYKQLFLRPHSVAKELWLLRDYDVQEAEESVSFYNRVKSGGLLILGAPLSGKSYLTEFVASKHFDQENRFSIMPPDQGSIAVSDFHRAIKKGLKYYGEIQAAFDHLPEKAVLEFHDAEKWWERSQHGFEVLHELTNLIEQYSNKALFIVNMNWHSFHLINDIGGIEESFFKIIKTQPFNAEELKQVILSRHQTSRIKFRWRGKHEDTLSDWKLAKLFTRYFDLSEGNVGVALQQWICHIKGVSPEGEIEIGTPKRPDREVLNSLGKDRLILLIQFVLHKQLNKIRLSRIMQMEEDELARQIEVLHRMDILREKNGVWEINRFLLPSLISIMEEELLL